MDNREHVVTDGTKIGITLTAVATHGKLLEAVEIEACKMVLNLYGGNRRLAAKALGVCEDTLSRKLRLILPKISADS